MGKPHILVDMDNVIADQVGGFYSVLAKTYPEIPLPPRDSLAFFDIELNFPEEHRDLIKSLRLEEGFFRSLSIVPGAKEGLGTLDQEEYDVWIVTAPTWEWKYCVPEKYAWVEEHLGRNWCGKIILTRDKTLVTGNILIDDAPTVTGIQKPVWTHVLYDQPYNRTVRDTERVTWSTVDTFIKKWVS